MKIVDSQFKKNKIVSFARSIQEDISSLKDALLDQIQSSLLEEDLADLLGKAGTYFNMMGSLMDLPDDADLEKAIKDFIRDQKPEFDTLKRETKDLRMKIQRISSDDAKLKEATRRAAQPNQSSLSSHLKLPRIQIPQFQDNATGTISWPNFHAILVRLTIGMNAEERIFLLKSALSGKGKKLVANEQGFDAAINMLQYCYGNELLESQFKIQEFVAMVTEEGHEKTSPDLNRDLWQRFKMFSNYLEDQLATKGHSKVLDTIVCALVVQRLPYHMKQLLIRSRREKEAATGHNISLEELLNLYNHLIHDVEIATTSKDTKRKADKWETEDKRRTDTTDHRTSARVAEACVRLLVGGEERVP